MLELYMKDVYKVKIFFCFASDGCFAFAFFGGAGVFLLAAKIAMIYAFCIPKTSKKILKRKIKAKAKGIKILIGFLAPYLVFYIF